MMMIVNMFFYYFITLALTWRSRDMFEFVCFSLFSFLRLYFNLAGWELTDSTEGIAALILPPSKCFPQAPPARFFAVSLTMKKSTPTPHMRQLFVSIRRQTIFIYSIWYLDLFERVIDSLSMHHNLNFITYQLIECP